MKRGSTFSTPPSPILKNSPQPDHWCCTLRTEFKLDMLWCVGLCLSNADQNRSIKNTIFSNRELREYQEGTTCHWRVYARYTKEPTRRTPSRATIKATRAAARLGTHQYESIHEHSSLINIWANQDLHLRTVSLSLKAPCMPYKP